MQTWQPRQKNLSTCTVKAKVFLSEIHSLGIVSLLILIFFSKLIVIFNDRADLFIYDIGSSLLDKLPGMKSSYPKFHAVKENVAKNDRIAEYIKQRKVTSF